MFQKVKTKLSKKVLASVEELSDKSIDELKEMQADMIADGDVKGNEYLAVKIQLAYKTFVQRKGELSKNDKFVEDVANKIDIKKKDILFKVLSHMGENVPELQELSKLFESTYFDMIEERYNLKNELEKLGRAVIAEKNKNLGLKGKAGSLFSSDNAKYFEYVLNEKEERYWTEEEAKKEGFSKAQIDFLNFMRKLQDMRNKQYAESGNVGEIDDIIKVDKGAKEAFKTEGLLSAFSSYLGNSYALKNAEVQFTDPSTNKTSVIPYGEVEQKLIDYGKKGPLQKANALRLLLKYNFKARRNTGEKVGQYNISPTGVLNNKFLKPRDKGRGYSKDFYKAAHTFIDDYTHTKHMSEIIPLVDSIEVLNKYGYAEHAAKPNVVKWLEDWKDLHLFRNEKTGALGPEADAALRTLRKVSSLAVMAFNIPAAGWNLFTGVYNSIRNESMALQYKGTQRLLGGLDRTKFKAYNKKAAEIIEKYQVVASDYNSNPKLFAGKLFDNLAHGLTRQAEYFIQSSLFLGQMTEKEWNMFDESGKLKENVTEEEKKALKEKMIKYKNRVSDIQGKYADKDMRNYMISEFGKAVGQYKTWLPDSWRVRFGEEYIDKDGIAHKGTWREFLGQAGKDLLSDIKQQGPKAIWNNKNAMANLKGAMTVAALLSIQLGGDDDKKKRGAADVIDKALGNVLMIFDPQSLKFTLTNPVPSVNVLIKFTEALNHGLELEFGKAGKDVMKTVPYNKLITKIPDIIEGEN